MAALSLRQKICVLAVLTVMLDENVDEGGGFGREKSSMKEKDMVFITL